METIWSIPPVRAPTTSFSTFCPNPAKAGGSRPNPHSSFTATATAHSTAAEDDKPAPVGTSEQIANETPSAVEPSLRWCAKAHTTPTT